MLKNVKIFALTVWVIVSLDHNLKGAQTMEAKINDIQLAIAKGKLVYFGNNIIEPVKYFNVGRLITIETVNVKRYKITALDYFLRQAHIL